ncbi:permease [Pseudomonas sp. LJDD11]|uniref:permease n=1 Tax=Pseudomonas sp. LJDD11 TaxID=2931984 RepID=UPI00211C9325|nr:permease [Pseudomonas sp. LJDD11]MCQ9422939.1 permease [Pseudomonas sp. LJDD11]
MPSKTDDYAPILDTAPAARQGNSEPIFQWVVKRINLRRKNIWLIPLILSIWPVSLGVLARDSFHTDPITFYCVLGGALTAEFYYLYFMLRPSIFNYRIYPECGEVDVQPYYAKYTKHVFNGVAIIAIIVLLGLAAFVGSLLFLLGPVALMIISALNIMEWKPPPCELETSMVWEKYNAVTVDRRYRIIVIHRTDLTIGFEARLPNKALFEQYLAFLRTVLPEVTTYREEVWKW